MFLLRAVVELLHQIGRIIETLFGAPGEGWAFYCSTLALAEG